MIPTVRLCEPLVQSTLFCVVEWLLTRALEKNRARFDTGSGWRHL